MTKTQNFTVNGGFHNVGEIAMRAKIDPRGGIQLSPAQARRLEAHMCTYKGCICGMHHGWLIKGVSRNDLSEALMDANAQRYLNSSRRR